MEFASGLIRRLPLPVIDTANLRLAHLDSATVFAGARAFPPERWSALDAFSPNVLAGSVAQLQRLIERIRLRTVSAAVVDHSIVVVTQLGDTPLTPRFRDRLWEQFGVPVYEVYLDEEVRLLAYECEAQEGWHIARDVRFTMSGGELLLHRGVEAVRTGLNWVIEESACACGRPERRLLQPLHPMANPVAIPA
jgi:hypothetical protein